MIPDSAKKKIKSNDKGFRLPTDSYASENGVEKEDLESFRFEVSAGEKLRLDDDVPRSKGLRLRADLPHHSEPHNSPLVSEPSLTENARFPQLEVAETSYYQKRSEKLPVWGTSFFIHLLAMLAFALFTFSINKQQVDFTLTLESDATIENEIELQDIEIDPMEEIESDVNQLASEIQEASRVMASELSAEVAIADLVSFSGSQEIGLGELSGLSFGSHGNGLSDMLPKAEKLKATFFETKIEGRRIVFVVDNSGGMRGGELETLVDELIKSVESLTTEQQFYVIFYSDMLYPLFYPQPVQRFVPADDRFKKSLRQWLETVEFCLGNEVDKAIEAAQMIRPDAVYLLTDGDLDSTRDQRRMAYLLNSQGRRFPIHTFGMGTGEKGRAADKLRQVAEANRGIFRAVKVSTAAKDAALEKRRPYHDKEPGEVWGLNVGGKWGRK
ncbi:VWA domain-containing protein [Bythopirellula polymerisocia]|uniref:VWFA domain-containing protein n=1 Tax=Bythopirellula polymerisocia TaxID=2528003 RepID=A0A5C6CJF7_9BACT|nr:VWA domain-containing protein [Bythopirellula polymerisocia]TWU24700.1 hypothetical protein Pla144_35860 [Bythopirellula polymerisocia]